MTRPGAGLETSVPASPRRAKTASRSRRPASRRRAGNAVATLELAQLLTSRICHDLINPVAIAASAEDLVEPGAPLDAEAIALLTESARKAAARLAFFRVAFGFGSETNGERSLASLAPVVAALASERVHIAWPAPGDVDADALLPVAASRLVLCAALMAAETLPRSGTIEARFSRHDGAVQVTITARGQGARPASGMQDAFAASDCCGLSPRTVVAHYAGCLAAELAAGVVFDAAPDCCSIALQLPKAA
jgi:histidine phosphotransferase ChpT